MLEEWGRDLPEQGGMSPRATEAMCGPGDSQV